MAAAALAVIVALAAPQAIAAPSGSSPMEVLKAANDKIAGIMKKKIPEAKQDIKIRKVVDKLLDFKLLTKASLGKHWKELSTEQQDEFVDLLTELIQRNYIKQVHKRKDEKWIMNYDSEEIEEKKAKVITTVVAEDRHDEETEVVYKMQKKGPRWVVVDILTDDVSLVRNYRSQFNKIIEKDGIEKLLEKMRKKLESDGDDDAL
ncbi:MAG: ABC transporter substrate-binding protein [Deltaproteobacteria bacterium]|nr:ABC transporter substrate-binding protein [Deltaproteobacteria bacterium]